MRCKALGLIACASLSLAQRLVTFQVAQPPPLPKDSRQCTIRLFEHTFANSYGAPAIVEYSPPTDCGEVGSWAGVSLNFTVTSNGTQFDRLGIFTFQNVEIWRTSTPEPSRTPEGIIWQYLKDVTRYIPLFAKSGTFVLELDNIVQTGLDGEYASTLDATFYASSSRHPPAPKADVIIPITTMGNNTGDDASVPPVFSLNVSLPRNAVAAYAELQASGNGQEEEWYYNIPNDYLPLLPPAATQSDMAFGHGPFREVRFLVDGKVAGVAFPYPSIFSGGISPTSWKPIIAYGAMDLPTYHFDLTPFVPLLTDGTTHNISLDVASAEEDHVINANWYVSGLLQVILDASDEPTTGKITKYEVDEYADSTQTLDSSRNNTLEFTVKATRSVHIESEIIAGSGEKTNVVFRQALAYSNTQSYLNNGSVQLSNQQSSGTVSSTHNGRVVLKDDFVYPLSVNTTFTDANFSDWQTWTDHSYNRELLPAPFLLSTTIAEHQVAGGNFSVRSTGNVGSNGTSENTFSYVDTKGNTYKQSVTAFENTITSNVESGSLAPSPLPRAN
ncbi:hypothetical protein PENSPDRAFT_684422 [Peniophora sp. CONT]|nr:hypothetical protein PENSPDRAFT_684422 [Peniophora sp. CONT]